MSFKEPDARKRKEPAIAYAAFLAYRDNRDLGEAYNIFMQDNSEALTSMKAFCKWASVWSWQARVNDYDAQQELFGRQETRRLGLTNSLTAETMAQELYTTCMEEMNLKRGDMTHRDIAKYMDICQKINDRWVKQPDVSPVTVNVKQNVEQNVKTETIDPEVAAEVGKALALKASMQAKVVEE